MSLYPSLEDMQVDRMVKAQVQQYGQASYTSTTYPAAAPPQYSATAPPSDTLARSQQLPYPISPYQPPAGVYPSLGDYLGLELSEEVIAANLPEYHQNMQVASRADMSVEPINRLGNMIAPLSSQSQGLQRAIVTNGIREITLCKDADGKVGLRVQALNKGILVSLVHKNSPAAQAGLRFGDQVLQVNGKNVAGFSMDQVHDMLKKSPVNGISLIIRDRPFERTVTLHKDSAGRVGFNFKDGKIIGLVVESSAARNGLLTEHQLLEVDGQNVVGLKDKELTRIISEAGDVVTVTVVPSFIYTHMTKTMNSSLLTSFMDHSIPSV